MSITLRFVTCHDIVSAAIRAYEYGFWTSHVEAKISGKLVGAHFSGGVQARDISYDASSLKREQYVEVPASDNQTKAFEQFMMAQVGKPYDVEAIAALVMERNWREPDRWFCSELVAAALEQSTLLPKLPDAINLIMPRDVMMMVSVFA
jgi:uncharacterized protein YycO